MNLSPDGRQYVPATQRNREPIVKVLLQILPTNGNILEIASGTGEHAVFFAPQVAPRQWIPSDPSPQSRISINAWREFCQCENLHPALDLDVREQKWEITPDIPINAVVNINMIHISSWSATLGLMAGTNRLLPSGGILYLYGPFKKGGKHTAPSNQAFEQMLRSQNPEWGVRDLDDVVTVAKENNLILEQVIPMPANNFSVILKKLKY